MTAWRYLAQRALTGEWLHWDLPIQRDELSWALSGAGSLRGTIAPDVGQLRAADGAPLLDEWGTLLYAEADGQIRWGGIVVRSRFAGAAWGVEAAGFTTYPHGIPYLAFYSPGAPVDPVDAVRELWREVQADDAGDLGVVVDPAAATPLRIGTAAEPYTLAWWEATDCGQEIDTLAKLTPFDYVEDHAWAGDTTVSHTIRIGYPRLGRRRLDLAFVQGDNVSAVVTAERDGDDYANEVLGIGAGEGRSALHRRIPLRDGRLRRPFVWTDKSVADTARMDALIRRELDARRNVLEFRQITVTNHRHAAIGSWQLGDDVLVQAHLPWLGDVAVWERVVGWSLVSEDRAVLRLRRSDAFTYGGGTA